MRSLLLSLGVILIVTGVAGASIKLFGAEIQIVKSIPRQLLLVIFGLLMLAGSGLIHIGERTEPQPAGTGGARGSRSVGGGPHPVGGGADAESGRHPRTDGGAEGRGAGGDTGTGGAGGSPRIEGDAAMGRSEGTLGAGGDARAPGVRRDAASGGSGGEVESPESGGHTGTGDAAGTVKPRTPENQ